MGYPNWVCYDCGKAAAEAQGKTPFTISTYHVDICGVCGERKACTEPRDFGYPSFPERVDPPTTSVL